MASYIIEWHLPTSFPLSDEYVIVETLDGEYIVDTLASFDCWSERVVKWGYLPQEIRAKIENALSDVEYLRGENEKLKKHVEGWHTKYLTLLGAYHNERQREAFIGKKTCEHNSRSDNSDGDEHLTADDLCELFKPNDARSLGEVSVDELRDIFLKVLRESEKRLQNELCKENGCRIINELEEVIEDDGK